MDVQRLDFVLPDFVRVAWVGDAAREVWAPRLRRIVEAWAAIEVAAVAQGVRPCALVRVSPSTSAALADLCTSNALLMRTLADVVEPSETPRAARRAHHDDADGPATAGRIAIGLARDVERLVIACRRGATDEIGALLGYPRCCRTAFVRRCEDDGLLDHTWAMCCASTAPPTAMGPSAMRLDLDAAECLNLFWRCVGIRPVPQMPCRTDCPDALRQRRAFRTVAAGARLQTEIDWLDTVLSWPVDWSALHGIAEIKTPILKITARTDATATKIAVRWHAEAYPDEGARGIAFPYRVSARTRAAVERRAAGPAVIPLRAV